MFKYIKRKRFTLILDFVFLLMFVILEMQNGTKVVLMLWLKKEKLEVDESILYIIQRSF